MQQGYNGMPQHDGANAYAMPAQSPVNLMPGSQGMFTRNLIGSLVVNATKLFDPEGKVGFWFVMQDLSVRTEGTFRYVPPGTTYTPHMY